MNNSASWTEEIARYLLIGTVFIGAAIGVAKNNHIQVDFFYRYMPAPMCRAMAAAGGRSAHRFLSAWRWCMTGQMMQKLGNYKMTIVDLPMNIVYAVCMLGFAAMFVRSFWVMRVHMKRGYSVLERPESTMEDR